MEFDWCSYEDTFFPFQRSSALGKKEILSSIYLIEDNGVICSAYTDGEDLREWIGSSLEDACSSLEHRDLFIFDLATIDGVLGALPEAPHFLEQTRILQEAINPEAVQRRKGKFTGKKAIQVYRDLTMYRHSGHFLIDAITGWWKKILPSTYGLYIRIEGHLDRELVLIVRGGNIRDFHTPDFSNLSHDQSRQPEKRVEYLSKNYMLPVQGLVFAEEDWLQWSQKSHPWRSMVRAHLRKRWRMVPSSFGRRFLLYLRAFLHL